jgi:hypothetical protein
MHVARLLSDHAKLRSLGAGLLGLVSSAEPSDLAELARLRWDLARAVHLHLAYEERHLFHRLEADPRADVRTAAASAKRGVEQLHRSYQAHVERWSADEMMNRWPEFQTAVRTLVSRMIAAIDREEVGLFPLIAHDGEVDRAWRSGMRNWAGDGVALQPLFSGAAQQQSQPACGTVKVWRR